MAKDRWRGRQGVTERCREGRGREVGETEVKDREVRGEKE